MAYGLHSAVSARVKADERLSAGEYRLARYCLQRKLLSPEEIRPILAAKMRDGTPSLIDLIQQSGLFNEAQVQVLMRIRAVLDKSPEAVPERVPAVDREEEASLSGAEASGESAPARTVEGPAIQPISETLPASDAVDPPGLNFQGACWVTSVPPTRTRREVMLTLLSLGGVTLILLLVLWSLANQQLTQLASLPKAIPPISHLSAAGNSRPQLRGGQTQPGNSIEAYDRAVTLAPKTAQPYLERGEFLARQGRWQQALEDYTRAVEIDADYGPALLARALAYEVLDRIPQAAADLQRARGLPRVRTRAECFIARLLNQSGNHRDALRMAQRTIERDPNASEAVLERGKGHFHLKQYVEASRDFLSVLKLRPSHQVALLYMGRMFLMQGDAQAAEEYFSRARKSAPSSPQLALILADFYSRWGRLVDARRWYLRAAELGGPAAPLANRLGLLAMREGRFTRALEHFGDAIEKDPRTTAFYNNRGNACYVLSQWDGAIRDFNTSLALSPGQSEVHYGLANAYGRSGQLRQAFHQFNEAIARNGEDARAHCYRATILYYMGNWRKALDGFENALSFRPKYPMARFYQANCEIELGNSERAIHLLGELVAENPKRPEYHHYLANAYMGLKYYQKAIQGYTRALQCNPENVESLINRAAAYRLRGLLDRSLADLIQVRALAPKRKGLEETIAALKGELGGRR